MPAPTIEEKVPTGAVATMKDAPMEPESSTTAKETTAVDARVTSDRANSKSALNDVALEKAKVDDTLTKKMIPDAEKEDNKSSLTKDENPALGSDVQKDGKKVNPPVKESDVVKGEMDAKTETDAEGTDVGRSGGEKLKTLEQAPTSRPKHDGNATVMEKPTDVEGEKKDISIKLDTSAPAFNVETNDTADKTAQPEKDMKNVSSDNVERPVVTFGAVEEVALEEDDNEYQPSEDQDAEGEDEEEDGEIGEGDDEPMLNLKDLPQSLTASLLARGAMNGPLHGPASKGNTDELLVLLSKGGEMEGKVDDPDVYQYTALHVACENDRLEACKLLVEHGADIEASTKMHECRPIHYAAVEGHDEIIAFLLEKGANINALTDDNRTPLYLAAMRGHDHCVELILQKGADRNLPDKEGNRPSDVAEKREIIDLLAGPPEKKTRRK